MPDATATFVHIENGQRRVWRVERLWRLAADLPVIDVPVADIPALDEVTWFALEPDRLPTGRRVAEHARRIYEADLTWPLILSRRHWVMDGMHRLCRAYLLGQETVRAVRFDVDPEPDEGL
jgi:hypothetical protein